MKPIEMRAHGVDCPTCFAVAGVFCTNADGTPKRGYHTARWKIWAEGQRFQRIEFRAAELFAMIIDLVRPLPRGVVQGIALRPIDAGELVTDRDVVTSSGYGLEDAVYLALWTRNGQRREGWHAHLNESMGWTHRVERRPRGKFERVALEYTPQNEEAWIGWLLREMCVANQLVRR
jgi:hypothetical protein